MGDDFKLSRYRGDERDAVFEFLRQVYPAADSERLVAHWRWKFETDPFDDEAEPYVLLARHGGRIVGAAGAIPLRVRIGGEERPIAGVSDLIVHPGYRRRGLGRRMSRRFRRDHAASLAWLNVRSRGMLAPLGGASIRRSHSWVKPLDAAVVARRALGAGGRVLGAAGALAGRFARPLLRRREAAGVTLRPVAAFDPRVDDLWRRAAGDYPALVVRRYPYLRWRFDRRPDAGYGVLLALRGETLAGYLVYRVTERLGLRIGYLVDVFVEGRSGALLAALVAEAEARARREGAALLSLRAPHRRFRRTLLCRGLVPDLRSPGYLYLRVDPPAWDGCPDLGRWYLTMGDGDLESGFS